MDDNDFRLHNGDRIEEEAESNDGTSVVQDKNLKSVGFDNVTVKKVPYLEQSDSSKEVHFDSCREGCIVEERY